MAIGQPNSHGDIFPAVKPVWSHVGIDSSAIGYQGRTGMDFFNYLAEGQILVDGNSAYLVYNNNFENGSGSFLERLNLETGQCLWQNAFDLRHSTKREETQRVFINDRRELELINLRNSYDTVDALFKSWPTGRLSVRKYDLESGQLVAHQFAPPQDTGYPEISTQIRAFLDKDQDGGYSWYTNYLSPSISGFGMSRIYLDSMGRQQRVGSSSVVRAKYVNSIYGTDIPRFLNNRADTIVKIVHSFREFPYIQGDSFELSLHLFDRDLNPLAHYDLTQQCLPAGGFTLVSTKNNHLGLYAEEDLRNGKPPMQRIISVTTGGKVLEDIRIPGNIFSSFGKSKGMIKLRNEPGVLWVTGNLSSASPRQLHFYKSDGQGNLQRVLEVELADNYMLGSATIEQLDDLDILISGRYRRGGISPSEWYATERFITSRWDAKDLSLITEVGGSEKKAGFISAYPNPAEEQFRISGLEDRTATLYLFDETGKMLKSGIHVDSATEVSTSGLAAGRYYIQLLDVRGALLYSGKVLVTKGK
ncbi:MAG TPA: T9SS type A sorting domain-containing protein [Saprospiraceae bacterium]|nr:T9SS type A sorting domain-containing protein [Saprospiraceae bacterium]